MLDVTSSLPLRHVELCMAHSPAPGFSLAVQNILKQQCWEITLIIQFISKKRFSNYFSFRMVHIQALNHICRHKLLQVSLCVGFFILFFINNKGVNYHMNSISCGLVQFSASTTQLKTIIRTYILYLIYFLFESKSAAVYQEYVALPTTHSLILMYCNNNRRAAT